MRETLTWKDRCFGHLAWVRQYKTNDLKFDLIAGVTVAMMIIPQEVSLSNIMHVPPQYGLYTAAITPVLYALFGSSRVLSVANGSEVSLMIGAALQSIKSEEERIAVGIFLSFYIGMTNLLLGCFRLGVVADFFSRPVMGGFLSGGGVLIMISQFPTWFQLTMPSSTYPIETLIDMGKNMRQINWYSFGVGAGSIALLAILKYAKKNWIPAPKLADIFDKPSSSTNVVSVETPANQPTSWAFSLDEQEYESMDQEKPHSSEDSQRKRNIYFFILRTACDLGPLFVCLFGAVIGYSVGEKKMKVTGAVPKGLPSPVLPWYGYTEGIIQSVKFTDVSIQAASIALVVYMTSIAMAKRLAVRGNYQVNPNQELVGLGVASAVGAFFQVMPPTGGMSRTAVNMQSAKTQLASVITVSLVMVLLVIGTEALYYLPKASLAAIIITAGYWLIEIEEATWLFHSKRDEFYVWLGSCVLTIGLGILEGLVASIICSLLAVLVKTKRPLIYVVGRTSDGRYLNTTTHPELNFVDQDGVMVIRIEGSLYFGNTEYATQFILHQTKLYPDLSGVIVDGIFLHDVDATTIQVFQTLQDKLAEFNIRFALANAQPTLASIAKSSGLAKGFSVVEVTESIETTLAMLNQTLPQGLT